MDRTDATSVSSLLLSIKNLETKAKLIKLLELQDAARHEFGLLHTLDSYSIVDIY